MQLLLVQMLKQLVVTVAVVAVCWSYECLYGGTPRARREGAGKGSACGCDTQGELPFRPQVIRAWGHADAQSCRARRSKPRLKPKLECRRCHFTRPDTASPSALPVCRELMPRVCYAKGASVLIYESCAPTAVGPLPVAPQNVPLSIIHAAVLYKRVVCLGSRLSMWVPGRVGRSRPPRARSSRTPSRRGSRRCPRRSTTSSAAIPPPPSYYSY